MQFSWIAEIAKGSLEHNFMYFLIPTEENVI